MGRTLVPAMASISLPEMMSKQLHFYFSNKEVEMNYTR
jgi:hypothetical protein